MNSEKKISVSKTTDKDSDNIDFFTLYGILISRKWTIIVSVSLFFLLGLFYTWATTPVFEANAIIQVEHQKAGIPGMKEMAEVLTGVSETVTEIELIRSRKIISSAVEELSLDIIIKPKYFPLIGEPIARRHSDLKPKESLFALKSYAWGGENIDVVTFDPPDQLLGKEHRIIYLGDRKYRLISPKGEKVLEGKVGEQYRTQGYVIYINMITARPNTEFLLTKSNNLSAVLEYQSRLNASQLGSDTGIIELTIQGENPKKAIQFLNIITKNFIRQNVERQSEEASKSLAFLKAQLPQIKQDLEKAEKSFNSYQVKVGSVDISMETGVLLDQIVDIEAEIAKLQLNKIELDRKFTKDHPNYETWNKKLSELKSRRAEMNSRIQALPKTQQELLGLHRELDVGTEIYTQMLNNIQELDIVRAGTVGNVRLIDDAIVNYSAPVKPKKTLIMLIAVLTGGLAGLVIIFVQNALSNGIESASEIEEIGLTVYASIPFSDEQIKLDRGNKSRRIGHATRYMHPKALLAQRKPTDIAVESLRSLRTSLHFAMLEAENNIIMISGPSPNVGKSFVSGNLAAVVAQAQQKVLVIDMDLRKGYMHKMFNTNSEKGVSDVLSRRISLAEAIQPTKVGELYFLPRGTIPPNPSELLMSQGLSKLLDQVKNQYDLIIVDTPPIMAVTDAAIVGRHCGVTMLVTRFGMNPIKELEATKQRFEQNGIAVKGVVLNAVERRASAYGYGYGYGYYHYEYKSDNKG